MKATIEREILHAAVRRVRKAVAASETMPILKNIKIEIIGDEMTLTACDMAMQLSSTVTVTHARKGATTVDGRMLESMIGKLPDGAQVALEHDGERAVMTVKAGHFSARLNTLPIDDFPDFPRDEAVFDGDLPSADFKRIIDRVAFAIAGNDASRANLAGLRLHTRDDDHLRAIGCDGHQLAIDEMALPKGVTEFPAITVPRDAVAALAALCDDTDLIRLRVSHARIEAEAGDTLLIAKLLDRDYPDYARVIPADNGQPLTAARKELMASLDRALTIANGKGHAVRLDVGEKRLTIEAVCIDATSAKHTAIEQLDIGFAGSPLAIGFNGGLLLDMLGHFDGDAIEISLGDPSMPAIIKPKDSSAFFAVLMPMRVGVPVKDAA